MPGGLITITDDGNFGYVEALTLDFDGANFVDNGNVYFTNFLLTVDGDLNLGSYYASGWCR